jgi:hypothetical protein
MDILKPHSMPTAVEIMQRDIKRVIHDDDVIKVTGRPRVQWQAPSFFGNKNAETPSSVPMLRSSRRAARGAIVWRGDGAMWLAAQPAPARRAKATGAPQASHVPAAVSPRWSEVWTYDQYTVHRSPKERRRRLSLTLLTKSRTLSFIVAQDQYMLK